MKIEHIALYVNDLEKCRDFFVKYFDGKSNDGYHNKTTDFRSYFISFDDGSQPEKRWLRSYQRATNNRRRLLRKLHSWH